LRVLVLVDGEHHPSVVHWGIEAARAAGHEVLAALFVGGREKLGARGLPDLGVRTVDGGADPPATLVAVLDELGPEAVLDLSDEPVLGYRERFRLAATALAHGRPYLGSDFRLDPPISGPPLPVPTIAVIGTGKRTGKTAIAAELARMAHRRDLRPFIVAMGRGGPPEPQVAEPGSVTVSRLLDLVRMGEHAASDYLEDALTTGVPAVGARRCGGGLAGAPFVTNVRSGAELAVESGAGIVILEGSGASIPPIPWDSGLLVVPVSAPPEYLGGYLGPFRLLLSDLVVFTMGSGPNGPENLFALKSHTQRVRGDVRLVVTDFVPVPLGDVRGRDAFFTTTAPGAVAERQVASLEEDHGCRVVGWSARLADRAGLAQDMEGAGRYEVLLTELKAAAVDVACAKALAKGADVVFVDNRPVALERGGDLAGALSESLDVAIRRHEERNPTNDDT
jgi:cyclic 2,3-diphosphoglycerate synthetase